MGGVTKVLLGESALTRQQHGERFSLLWEREVNRQRRRGHVSMPMHGAAVRGKEDHARRSAVTLPSVAVVGVYMHPAITVSVGDLMPVHVVIQHRAQI